MGKDSCSQSVGLLAGSIADLQDECHRGIFQWRDVINETENDSSLGKPILAVGLVLLLCLATFLVWPRTSESEETLAKPSLTGVDEERGNLPRRQGLPKNPKVQSFELNDVASIHVAKAINPNELARLHGRFVGYENRLEFRPEKVQATSDIGWMDHVAGILESPLLPAFMGVENVNLEGHFEIPAFCRRRPALIGYAPGGEIFVFNAPRAGGSNDLVVDLGGGEPVHGFVRDEVGQPIAEAVVVLATYEGGLEPAVYWRCRSQFDGSFRAPNIDRESAALVAVAQGFAPTGFVDYETTGDFTITLSRESILSGVIQDPTGKMIQEPVAVRVEIESGFHKTITANGTFEIRGVGNDNSILVFGTHKGLWQLDEGGNVVKNGVDPEFVSEFESRVVLVMGPGRTVEGTVVDTLGRPVVGARVVGIGATRKLGADQHAVTLSEEGGRFRLSNLPPGTVQVTAFRNDLYPSSQPMDIPQVTKPKTIVIELTPVRKVAGRVIDELGQPVQGCLVTINYDCLGWYSREKQWDPLSNFQHAVLTAADGSFAGLVAPKGVEVHLVVSHPDMVGVLGMVPPEKSEDIVLTLPVTTSIKGVIVDEDGDPVAYARLQVAMLGDNTIVGWAKDDWELSGPRSRTDGQGHFFVAGLPAGKFQLELEDITLGVRVLQPGQVNSFRFTVPKNQ